MRVEGTVDRDFGWHVGVNNSWSTVASSDRLEQSQRVRDSSVKRKGTSESAGWAKGNVLIAKAVGNCS